jgi:hypothetical protein
MRAFVVRLIVVAIAVVFLVPSLASGQRRLRARRAPSGRAVASASVDEAQRQRDQEARALYDEGAAAFDAGEYELALQRFEGAYALCARPGLLFNIGSTAERLRRDHEALRAYEAYLEAAPDASNREYAEARIVFLREQVRLRDAELAAAAVPEPAPVAVIVPPTPEPDARDEERDRASELDEAAPAQPARRRVAPETPDETAARAARSATEPVDAEPDGGPGVIGEWWFWTVIGVAVVGTAAGVTAGVVSADPGPAPTPVAPGDFGPGGVIVALERF